MLLHQIEREHFVAGGDRGVGGEHGVPAHRRAGPGKVLAPHDLLANAFESKHRDVTFVHMPHRGLNPESPDGADASDSQHDLLGQTHLASADVEQAGDGAIGRIVQRNISVKEKDMDATHAGDPDQCLDHPARQVDGNRERASFGSSHRTNGQAREVVVGIDVLLESIGIDGLAEIPRPIQQTHAEERKAQIRRCLAVVAGQDAQAP